MFESVSKAEIKLKVFGCFFSTTDWHWSAFSGIMCCYCFYVLNISLVLMNSSAT